MTREFSKPLNQMTDEIFTYFWQLRSKLEHDDTCDCDELDELNEAYEMSDALLDQKNDCEKMDTLAERMIAELGKRDNLSKEWKDGYKKCIANLQWLSSKLNTITQDNSSDYDMLIVLRREISKKSYEINEFVSSLQKIIEYDLRYTKILDGKNYVLQCVEIPEIKATVTKEKEDGDIMASYHIMNEKISHFVREFPGKVRPFENNNNQHEINIRSVISEI